ncbi:MAG: hypothetical protein ABR608_13900 [Pseudonocardiaceae bacterium]
MGGSQIRLPRHRAAPTLRTPKGTFTGPDYIVDVRVLAGPALARAAAGAGMSTLGGTSRYPIVVIFAGLSVSPGVAASRIVLSAAVVEVAAA